MLFPSPDFRLHPTFSGTATQKWILGGGKVMSTLFIHSLPSPLLPSPFYSIVFPSTFPHFFLRLDWLPSFCPSTILPHCVTDASPIVSPRRIGTTSVASLAAVFFFTPPSPRLLSPPLLSSPELSTSSMLSTLSANLYSS